jgi:UDP-glucuronate 4-epimerase
MPARPQNVHTRALQTTRGWAKTLGMTILVTGAAGFIGFHVTVKLLELGRRVIGVDNFNSYYDVRLKNSRWSQLKNHEGFYGRRADLADRRAIFKLCDENEPTHIIHLGAQAGVRYGIENPEAYTNSNLVGFMNILEAARALKVDHFVFASTSSVYGANTTLPFAEHYTADHQMSLYAATKRANEAFAHSYAHLYKIPCTGLRFFTVYGPWGRPDMAPQKFTAQIFAGDPIDVYNDGKMERDFTFIDDIVDGIVRVIDHIPAVDEAWDSSNPAPDGSGIAPYRIFNIGRGEPVNLMDFIATLERHIGQKATLNFMPMQPGDVEKTWGDVNALRRAVQYEPKISIDEGLEITVAWFRDYYKV